MSDDWPIDGPFGPRYKSACNDPFVGFEEHPSSIDRSTAESVQDDRQTLTVGELLTLDSRLSLQYGGVSGKVIAPDGSVVYDGQLNSTVAIRAGQAGTYTAKGPCGTIDQVKVRPGSGNTGEDTVGNPSDWVNTDDPSETRIDPSNYRWIVNADNDEGIAPAPFLRRQGVELGPNGATFRFPNGETVDIGTIEDADEVARHLDGVKAGDVIDADQDVVGDGSNSSSNRSSSGDFGTAGATAGALALAYLIYRRQ